MHSVGYSSVATFIHLAVVASQLCEISWNSPKIWSYSSSKSSKVINLGINQSTYATSY